jgi:hypothetical protein
MKYLSACALLFLSAIVCASLPIQVSEEELIKNTDHLIIGRVVGVDMVDANGKEISDLKARTGPGLTNTIRLIVEVESVVLSNAKEVPHILKVPLDPFMHFNLGQIKEAHAGEQPPFLLLLKGSNFEPPFPGVFGKDIAEKEKFSKAIKSNKALQHAPSALDSL